VVIFQSCTGIQEH